ncbi:MAG: cytochrome c-type biogenesis protein CcmH [Polyangiaceae bacterium]|nr:cytochrome c-type biogenesis protein CcmH [Polyangiaceae bacterium]MCW5791357.1 cytochrome c-type biogenesis protein CcmH [Polyangiaceae bacterium]
MAGAGSRWFAGAGVATLVAGLLLTAPAVGHEAHDAGPASKVAGEYVAGADRLEGRLLAPCCWDTSKQTLDIHDSPVANALKSEIRARLKAGETADAIEADLVARYGEKIRAVPEGNPLRRVGLLLSVLVAAAGVGLGYKLVGWRRRREASLPAPEVGGERDAWDDALDAELARED